MSFWAQAQGLHDSMEKKRGLLMPLYNNSCAVDIFTAIKWTNNTEFFLSSFLYIVLDIN
jgi:hypothetical protein